MANPGYLREEHMRIETDICLCVRGQWYVRQNTQVYITVHRLKTVSKLENERGRESKFPLKF